MGTFLQTGLIIEFSFGVSPAGLKQISLDEFAGNVARTVVDNPDSFTCKNDGRGFYSWRWKPDVRRQHLVPLLTRFYADFYGKNREDFATYCEPVLSFLATDPSDEDFISWAENEAEDGFYLLDDWFRMTTLNGRDVRVNVSMVSLTSEGKVIVEELQQHISFFEKALRTMYGDNPLGKCLTVDIG